MSDLTLIKPLIGNQQESERLEYILSRSLKSYTYDTIKTAEEFALADLKGKKVLFVIALDET
jgi:hypothetical protein